MAFHDENEAGSNRPRSTSEPLLGRPQPHHLDLPFVHDVAALTTHQKFSLLPFEAALEEFKVSDMKRGLSNQQVEERLETYGLNVLKPSEKETLLSKIIEQFRNPLILLLFASAFVSLLMGQYDDAFSITLAIFIVVTDNS